jgi:hypothetical protein
VERMIEVSYVGVGVLLNLATHIIPTRLKEFQATFVFVRTEKIVLEAKDG